MLVNRNLKFLKFFYALIKIMEKITKCRGCRKKAEVKAFSIWLCNECFIKIYEKRVFKVIKRYKLVKEGDRIAVALSGGKDSNCAFYLLKKFIDRNKVGAEVFIYHINFSLPMSNNVEKVIKGIAQKEDVELVVTNIKDLGIEMERLAKRFRYRAICSLCAVIKRYLMNKIPREHKANKLATGHHMDDFILFFIKNIIAQQYEWISKFSPIALSNHPKILSRIRPLFEVGGKENGIYCGLNNIHYLEGDFCPHAFINSKLDLNRRRWYKLFYEIEEWQPDFRLNFVRSIAKMSKYFVSEIKLNECKICGEPTNKDVCGFCKLK